MVCGPKVIIPGAFEEISQKKQAYSLEASQYVKLLDRATGKRWVEKGPMLLFPKPTWEVLDGGVQRAISLKKVEYVRLIDGISGAIRVERGEQLVFPSATETILEGEGVGVIGLG